MTILKKAKPKAAAQTSSVASEEMGVLRHLLHSLSGAGFDQHLELKPTEAGMSGAVAWGRHEGVETPRILVLVLPPGTSEWNNANSIQMLSYTLPPPETAADHYPQ